MSNVAIDFTVRLARMDCNECGGSYALNEAYLKNKRENGGTWNCPYCKISYGFVKSEKAALEDEIKRLSGRIEMEKNRRDAAQREAEAATRRLRAQRGVVTRIKKRIANGVCPCCKRTFVNLQRHMGSQHPDYAEVTHGE